MSLKRPGSPLRAVPVLVLLGILLAACGGPSAAQVAPTQPPAPTAVAAPTTASQPTDVPQPTTAAVAPTDAPQPTTAAAPSDDQIKAGVQQALDLYAQAYNKGDAELLKQAVDQSNAPLRRFH